MAKNKVKFYENMRTWKTPAWTVRLWCIDVAPAFEEELNELLATFYQRYFPGLDSSLRSDVMAAIEKELAHVLTAFEVTDRHGNGRVAYIQWP